MSVPRPVPVDLLPDEVALRDEIDFSLSSREDRRIKSTLAAAAVLTRKLIDRGAVPDIRRRYLSDPELHVGSKISRMEVFESNGTMGEAIFGHGNFLEYLKYILDGPDLPDSTIDGFRRIIEEDQGTSGMVMDQLKKFTRAEVRRLGMERNRAREEFFKLALECELGSYLTLVIRDAAGSAK